jgi:hypothetical protein
MVRLNLSVSEDVKSRAEAQAAERGFVSLDAYIASLVDADAAEPVGAALEQELLAGLGASHSREMKPADWDEMRRRYRESRSRGAGAP